MKKHEVPYRQMTTWELIRQLIIARLPVKKEKVSDHKINPQPNIPEEEISYIAIVLDGVVEDVMRSQNRLAALLLSDPVFVEFDPKKERPQIGKTLYSEGKFSEPVEQLMTDEELAQMINKEEPKDEG